jgi:hypothetical protein
MAAMANGMVSGSLPVGPGGIFSLGDPGGLELLAKGAGFVDVAVEERAITFRADTVDAHVERVGSLAGPLAAVLQGCLARPASRSSPNRRRTGCSVPHRRWPQDPRAGATCIRPTLRRCTAARSCPPLDTIGAASPISRTVVLERQRQAAARAERFRSVITTR